MVLGQWGGSGLGGSHSTAQHMKPTLRGRRRAEAESKGRAPRLGLPPGLFPQCGFLGSKHMAGGIPTAGLGQVRQVGVLK